MELLIDIALALGIAAILRGFVFTLVCVKGFSMSETLKTGVIGLPGDTLEISDGVTYINGAALVEPYVAHPTRRSFAQITLGRDEYFVMGDNRACSRDSRVVGPLKRRQIFAVARLKLWPRGGKVLL